MKLITILITLLITFSSTICFADEDVKTYIFNEEITINGVLGSSSKFFKIEENMKVEDAKINIVFTKSELLDPIDSTLTVYINDTPVSSKRLDSEKVYKDELSISIPSELIKSGYNEIKIKAYKTMKGSDLICRDDNNVANWLVIHDNSSINVKYQYNKYENKISKYENIFMSVDNASKLNTTVVVPKEYTSKELTSAMIVSSDIGKKIKYENYNLNFVTDDNLNNIKDNIIYVANGSNTNSDILSLLTEDEKNSLDKNCIIKIADSKYNENKKILLVISNNDDLLIKGSKLLSSDSLIKNIEKDTLVINSNTDVYDLNKEGSSNKIYLKDLGYENIYLKGPFTQEASIDINTEKSKIVSQGSKVKLNLRYSDNLDYDRSVVSVYVNNIPIGSKKLEKEKCNDDNIVFNLPKEVLNKNYYQIKIVFSLEVKDLACVTRDMDTPWAYVGNDSSIELSYEDNNELSFKNYPYPFIKKSIFNDLSVVIPNDLTANGLNNVANIISFMGHDLKYNNGEINIIKESEFGKENKKDNLVFIGTPSNNSLLKDINNKLNLKFEDDFLGFKSDNNIKFIDDVSSQVSCIQLIESPFDKEKNAMVVASTDEADLSLATKYLSDLSLVKSLKGDTTVIYRNGMVDDLEYNISHTDIEVDEKEEKLKIFNMDKQGKIFIGITVCLLFMIIISIVFLTRKYKK